MSLSRRLDVLTKCYPGRPAPPPAFDFSGLTMEERFELDAILAKLEGVPTLPTGRPDLSPLSDTELERLDALAAHVTLKDAP
jgi:hypothetical protein